MLCKPSVFAVVTMWVAILSSEHAGLAQVPGRVRNRLPYDATPKPVLIGVMGQVAKPGVYEQMEKTPTLRQVLQRAGGLTTRAAGLVRIVRSGRVAQQVFLGTELNVAQSRETLLQSGDIIVADEQQQASRARIVRRGANADSVVTVVDSQPVPVALIGILDRPVILPVPQANARLIDVLAFLRQSPELAERVKQLAVSPARSQQVRLANGDFVGPTVLVFPRNLVSVDALPALPPVFEFKRMQTVEVVPERPRSGATGPVRRDSGATLFPQDTPGREIVTAPTPKLPPLSVELLPPENAHSLPVLRPVPETNGTADHAPSATGDSRNPVLSLPRLPAPNSENRDAGPRSEPAVSANEPLMIAQLRAAERQADAEVSTPALPVGARPVEATSTTVRPHNEISRAAARPADLQGESPSANIGDTLMGDVPVSQRAWLIAGAGLLAVVVLFGLQVWFGGHSTPATAVTETPASQHRVDGGHRTEDMLSPHVVNRPHTARTPAARPQPAASAEPVVPVATTPSAAVERPPTESAASAETSMAEKAEESATEPDDVTSAILANGWSESLASLANLAESVREQIPAAPASDETAEPTTGWTNPSPAESVAATNDGNTDTVDESSHANAWSASGWVDDVNSAPPAPQTRSQSPHRSLFESALARVNETHRDRRAA